MISSATTHERSPIMKKVILGSLLAGGLTIGAATFPASAAKPRETDVQKALKEVYPDAQTQVTGTRDVNGVQVSEVKVTTKAGESAAELTQYGDFLSYGVPRNEGGLNNMISQATGGVFKSQPQDVDMF